MLVLFEKYVDLLDEALSSSQSVCMHDADSRMKFIYMGVDVERGLYYYTFILPEKIVGLVTISAQ